MESSTIRSILLDGGAGYNVYTTKINFPSDIFSVLNPLAKALITFDLAKPGQPFRPIELVPDKWDDTQRELFYRMSVKNQIDVCAFVTSIVHESFHHLDLLRTPFGASLHEKLCREFLDFERWTPTLLDAPVGFFDQPLADWAVSVAPGPDEARKLHEGSLLDQALVSLRGTIPFDEVRRGTMPRHVVEGWRGNNDLLTLTGGRKYEKVTVNQLWPTLRLKDGSCYLSPNDIIEGRTLALCLIYLLHLLGDDPSAIDVVRRYVDHFYSGQSTYFALLEIHSGTDIATLFNENVDTLKRRLWETAANGWYSLHAPVVVEKDDVLQSMTARCVQAARMMRDTNLFSFSKVSKFLSAIEDHYSSLGARPIENSLKISAQRLNSTISMCDDCRDPEMRNWYHDILRVIRDDLLERIPSGYELGTGLPPDGNPIRWSDNGAIRCFRLREAPERIIEWYVLRQLLLTKRGRAKEKAQRLRDFFGD
jgi:hypothetical protein